MHLQKGGLFMEEMETLEVQPEVVAEGPEAAPEAVAVVQHLQ